MAAAGPPVAKFSNLFGQADLWDSPDVDMAPIHTVLGSGSTENLSQSAAVAVSADLLLACCLANAACAVMNIMTTLIFIIVLHAFFPVVVVGLSLHEPVVVAVNPCFQQNNHCPNFRIFTCAWYSQRTV